ITIGGSVRPSILRARIDGAVMRLPGTGEGVARLVEVSMVKVDMAAASSGAAGAPPARLFAAAQPAPCASEIESSTAVLWSRMIVKARRMAQVASSWQSPHGA